MDWVSLSEQSGQILHIYSHQLEEKMDSQPFTFMLSQCVCVCVCVRACVCVKNLLRLCYDMNVHNTLNTVKMQCFVTQTSGNCTDTNFKERKPGVLKHVCVRGYETDLRCTETFNLRCSEA